MHRSPQGVRLILLTLFALAIAALACNAAGTEPVDRQATSDALFVTITAQAQAAATTASQPTTTATAQPSQTPMNTTTPLPSATPPTTRTGNGNNLVIPACSQNVTINADPNDWVSMSGAIRFPLDTNTYGAEQWTGAADASGYARLCWTNSALYVFIEVIDDAHVQTETGSTSWKGDEIEFLFDGDLMGDFFDSLWNSDDTQIGLSPGDFNDLPPAAMRYFPSIEPAQGVNITARAITGGNYVLEAAIAWTELRTTPESGKSYGLCLALSDNDNPEEAVQQSMVGHCTGLKVANPTTWVTVELGP